MATLHQPRVFRVFVSSTASDLAAHRRAVVDTLERLGQSSVRMETFGARPDTPVTVCTNLAASADAMVVLVGHRLGWAPGIDAGGDGERSITWWEVDSAFKAGRPVFAFLVNEASPWTEPKEQDRLCEVDTEPEFVQVGKAVKRLQAFKDYLASRTTFSTFSSVDDLKAKVASSLLPWLIQESYQVSAPSTSTRLPAIREVHTLQRAPHFQGRSKLIGRLSRWWKTPQTGDRVISLVAAGGTGKTAIAEKLLQEIREGALQGCALVWSFYENDKTEVFLRTACEFFAGSRGASLGGGLLEQLQIALSDGQPHLIILDGLERIQSEGGSGRSRGELVDHQLKLLLRSISAGLGKTRALVTSRFEMVDLRDWNGAGHLGIRLDDLDRESARALLRAWEVHGPDAGLDALADRVGRHALSLAVLGSFVANFYDGDPALASAMDLDTASEDDAKAAKLRRVLAYYAEALPAGERDLLARLSTFARGVKLEILEFITGATDDVAGSLKGLPSLNLLHLLDRLRQRGLLFGYRKGSAAHFTAHPFLRDTFKGLLGVPAERIHEAVRARLAPGLETRPGSYPVEAATLDRYEDLIEQTRLAGRVGEALDLFKHGLGAWEHLGNILGEYSRGGRILAAFSSDGSPEKVAAKLSRSDRIDLITTWSLFSEALGDLAVAERSMAFVVSLDRASSDAFGLAMNLENLAEIQRLRGTLYKAHESADEALVHATQSRNQLLLSNSHCYLAVVLHALGRSEESETHFYLAGNTDGGPLQGGLRGLWAAEWLAVTGRPEEALKWTEANLELSLRNRWNRTAACCHTLLGQLKIAVDVAAARSHLASARRWSSQADDVETRLRAHLLASAIAQHTDDTKAALAEARNGLRLAGDCGFRLYAIDLQLALARSYLQISEPAAGINHAQDALTSCRLKHCGYAWGEAEALHLIGVSCKQSGKMQLARRHLAAAVEIRRRIGDPLAVQSHAELEGLREAGKQE